MKGHYTDNDSELRGFNVPKYDDLSQLKDNYTSHLRHSVNKYTDNEFTHSLSRQLSAHGCTYFEDLSVRELIIYSILRGYIPIICYEISHYLQMHVAI